MGSKPDRERGAAGEPFGDGKGQEGERGELAEAKREGAEVERAFASVTAPILSLSFTDDAYMSARNIESLHGFYRNAQREMRRLDPRTMGVRGIGHFGFFRRKHGDQLWSHAGEWLRRHVPQA